VPDERRVHVGDDRVVAGSDELRGAASADRLGNIGWDAYVSGHGQAAPRCAGARCGGGRLLTGGEEPASRGTRSTKVGFADLPLIERVGSRCAITVPQKTGSVESLDTIRQERTSRNTTTDNQSP
jgi:hypothetical protein